MRKLWFLAMVTAVILLAGGNVAPVLGAASQAPDPEQRIATQQKRIDQALQAKEVTPDGAKPLQGGLDKIKEEITRMKADGQLTKEEKDKLNGMLNQNSQLIDQTRKASKTAAAPAKAATEATAAKPAPAATAGTAPAATPAKPAPAAPAGTAPAATPAKPATTPAKPGAAPAPPPSKPVTPAAQDPGIQAAIADQQKRVNQGIQAKQLTLQESKTLEGNLAHIRQEDTRLRADGDFTQAEKDQLTGLLNQNDKMIKDKKNNPVKNMAETRTLSEREYSITERFANQQRNIDRGLKSKELTQQEAKVVQDNLNYIKNEDARLRAAGKLSDQEKNRLHILLDQNRAMIENKKDNPVKVIK
jgi:hypothetical protein